MPISMKLNSSVNLGRTYYQHYIAPGDGTVAVRHIAGGPWEVLEGDKVSSDAARFCECQNPAWAEGTAESVAEYIAIHGPLA